MSGAADQTSPASHTGEGPGGHFWQNVVAAGVCIAWNATFLTMSLGLPEGHSRGDIGPGALPSQVAMFGLAVSLIYLVQALRGVDFGGSDGPVDVPRVAALVAIFVAVAVSAPWIGLPIALGLGACVGTLLFPGDRPWIRAVATGAGIWAIAFFLFGKVLGLPLP